MLRKLPLTERTMNGTGIGHWRLKYFAHNLLGHLLTLLTQRLRKYPLMAGLDYGITFRLHTCFFFRGVLHLLRYPKSFVPFDLKCYSLNEVLIIFIILNNYKTIASQIRYLTSRVHS